MKKTVAILLLLSLSPLDVAAEFKKAAKKEIAALLRKHSGKTGLENTAKYTNYPRNYL